MPEQIILTCDHCDRTTDADDPDPWCGECGMCADHCECEPATCYYTGRGPCGDCRNVNTNQPMNCFGAPR